ncbi:MAG: hypothetical protein ABI947_19430 [Chloroflexota bacterium]
MIIRILLRLLLIVLIVAVGFAGYTYLTHSVIYPEAQAILKMQSGSAVVIHTLSGKEDSVAAGKQAVISAKDSIRVDGMGTLFFAGAQTDIMPETELEIRRYNAYGDEAQIDLLLKVGQILQRLSSYTSRYSFYSINSGLGSMTMRGGEFAAYVSSNGITQFASVTGAAAVTDYKEHSVSLNSGEGTLIAAGEAPIPPTAWSTVSVPVYGPDGAPVALPVLFTNETSGDTYHFVSNHLYLFPPGSYTLKVVALTSYELKNLKLTPGVLNEWPFTLSEVTFKLDDQIGTALTKQGLILRSPDAQNINILPDKPLLVLPGNYNDDDHIMASKESKPEAMQPINFSVEPGQRITLPLQNSLFGGGTIRVLLSNPDGSTPPSVEVRVFTPDNETTPVAVFNSDEPSPLLAAGDYIVSVRTKIAGRYPVNVPPDLRPDHFAPVKVELGYLAINYLDAQGTPSPRNPTVYIALTSEMDRQGLTIDQMRQQTPYGLGLDLATANRLLVPVGAYTVLIKDRADVGPETVEVKAGEVEPVTLHAPTQ